MSRNGSGVYNLVSGNPVVTGTTISSSWANSTLTDIAAALTGSIASDGQTVISANLPMSTYAHTSVGVATARTMYGSAGQIQDSSLTYLTNIAGADVITAVAPVLMTAYATGQVFHFIAASDNTSAVTVNINAIGAVDVKTVTGDDLVAGDIVADAVVQIIYDGTNFQFINRDSTNSGDVVGPASSTDNILAAFDGTTGKLIKVSTADSTIDGTNKVGYLNIPQNSQSANYTLILSDSGKYIYHPTTDANARTFTIPANSSVAYPIGTALTFINMTAEVVTIAITSDTMYLSSAGTTGSRTLAQYGSATAIKMTSTTWLISGSGLT